MKIKNEVATLGVLLSLLSWPVFGQSPEIEALLKAAEKNSKEAMIELGERYWDGNGVEVSLEKAWQWFRKVAESGDASAQYDYAIRIMELGLHADSDANEKEAFSWFLKAAEAGNTDAMASVAHCYRTGMGAAENLSKAVEWYQKAAEKKHPAALLALGELSEDGLGGLEKSLANAVYFFQLAAELGSEEARFNLGYMYFEGRGVTKDVAKGVELLKLAAKGEQVDAQFELARCYAEGIGVEKNEIAAVKLLKKAVAQDHFEARYYLAEHLYHGRGVEKNLARAYALLFNFAAFDPSGDENSPMLQLASQLAEKIEAEMAPEQYDEAEKLISAEGKDEN